MSRPAGLQIIGPVTIFAALLAAEIAAYALALYPSSQALWSINLRLFSIFRTGDYVLSSHIDITYLQITFIGLPLFATSCYGFFFNRRLALAIASSLAFIYVSFLSCAWYVDGHAWHQASFVVMGVPLLGASLLSFVVSHMAYLRACRVEGDVIKLLFFRGRPDCDRRRIVLRGAQ
jgi:hypothetical protein